jgi:hypothetical protein
LPPLLHLPHFSLIGFCQVARTIGDAVLIGSILRGLDCGGVCVDCAGQSAKRLIAIRVTGVEAV